MHQKRIQMKKEFILLLIAFTLLNCETKSKTIELDSKEINAIVEAVIIQDSLNVLKDKKGSKMFCTELEAVRIEIPVKLKNGLTPPPFPGNQFISNILKTKINDEVFFSKKDSANIMSQSSTLEKFEIGNAISSKVNATTIEKEFKKKENGKDYNFYQMKIPIFSLDKQKAYVELNRYCGHLCGSGKAIYLKKINGKWIIIEKWRTWIS